MSKHNQKPISGICLGKEEFKNLLGDWEVYLEEHKKVINEQAKRIKELEEKLRDERNNRSDGSRGG